MAACAPISPAAGSAETMVATVDCYVQSSVQAGYASLLGPGSMFGTALTIALTLYVAFVGYRLIFGRSGLSVGDLAPRLLLIGAVLALSSNWATYQVLVYNVLTDGPEEIASAINPGVGQAGLNERVDMLSGRMIDLADAWTEFDARPDQAVAAMPTAAPETLPTTATGITAFVAPKDSLGPNMLLMSALLLVLASAGAFSGGRERYQDNVVSFDAAKYGRDFFRVSPASPLPPGEYALSTHGSTDGFLFGVDP